MSTPPGRDELVAQFIGVTNAPASEAEHLLEAAGWDLDTAAQLHFEGAGNAAATASTAPAPRAEDEMQDLDEFMNNARMPRPGPTAPQIGEDGVRVADSVKRERLFDTRHTRQPRVHIGHGGPDVQPMPFGDLDPDASKRTGPGLDSIYQPPNEILSSLQLAEIKGEAERDDKWILFNLQDNTIFASLQLNADLWRNNLIQDIVRGSFIFCQRSLPGRDAQTLQEQYDLRVLPAVIIVDPNTGQKMHEWRGRIDADRFMEDVVPFLDISPSDPKAGTLVSASVKQLAFQNRHIAPVDVGSHGVAGVSAEDEDLNQVIAASLEDHAAVAAVHGDGAGTSQGTTRTAVGAGLGGALGDDEAALEAAIAASLGELPLAAGPSGAQPNGANTAMDDVAVVGSRLGGAAEGDDAQPGSVAAPKVSGADRKAEAAARLAPEPTDQSNAVRVGMQLPSGRAVRKFAADTPVESLYDWALQNLTNEQAEMEFTLVPAAPGSQPLSDLAQTLQDAGVAGGMLRLHFND